MSGYVLTVSIAAYNVEKYIIDTLLSFTDLDERNSVEVLIVDDGSTDNTAEIAQKFVNKYPQTFKLISKKNGGWGSTVNCGLSNAQGRYFKQLDGDDYFDKDNLDDFVAFLKKQDSDLVISPFRSFCDEDGKILSRTNYPDLEGIGKEIPVEDMVQYYPNMEMHSACFKTSLIRDIRLQEHCFYTDVELMVKAFSRVRTVSYFSKDLYCYRLGREGQSMSWKGIVKHYKEHEKVCLVLAEFCSNYHGPVEVGDLLLRRTSSMVGFQYMVFFLMGKQRNNRQEVKDFDDNLCLQYKKIYDSIHSRKVKLLRRTGFRGYKLCCLLTKSDS